MAVERELAHEERQLYVGQFLRAFAKLVLGDGNQAELDDRSGWVMHRVRFLTNGGNGFAQITSSTVEKWHRQYAFGERQGLLVDGASRLQVREPLVAAHPS